MDTPITISKRDKPARQTKHLTIGCLIFPRMDQIDFTGPFEVLSRIPTSAIHVIAKTKSPLRVQFLLIGDEEGAAPLATLQGALNSFENVVDVAGVKGIVTTVDEGELPGADCAFPASESVPEYQFREFIASLASLQGLSIDKLRSMPYGIASTLGRLMDAVWAITRRDGDPPISRSMMRMIGREFTVNDASARRELGYVGKTSRALGLRSYGYPSAEPPNHSEPQ